MSPCQRCFKTVLNERVWYMYLWAGGLSFRTIAKMTGRSPTTVRKWVRRMLSDSLLCYYGVGGAVLSRPMH